jgi:hypothetical protein
MTSEYHAMRRARAADEAHGAVKKLIEAIEAEGRADPMGDRSRVAMRYRSVAILRAALGTINSESSIRVKAT